jgi:hypothetical protein
VAVLPEPQDVKDLLIALLGKKINVSPGPGADPKKAVSALYVDDAGSVVAATLCDMSLAAHAGAALSLIPPRVAEESVRDGVLSDNLAENFGEILNIGSQLFASVGKHVKHQGPLDPKAGNPPLALNGLKTRLDLDVEIVGSGSGGMSLLVI